jgi:hypothetical protein
LKRPTVASPLALAQVNARLEFIRERYDQSNYAGMVYDRERLALETVLWLAERTGICIHGPLDPTKEQELCTWLEADCGH